MTDSATIRDIVAPLRAASSTRLLAIIATTLTDLGERVFGVPVVHLGGLPADDVKYLLEVGGGAGDVEARARELVVAAHGAPGAVRAALAEGTETAIRDDLRDAIAQAITGQEEEERSFAAITAGLLALRGDATTGPGSATGETAPYKGLVAYGAEDSAWFCGRDELTAQLLARITISRFIAVTGSSGGGKSSLVRAGLHRGTTGRRHRRQRLLADHDVHTPRLAAGRVGRAARGRTREVTRRRCSPTG